MFGAVGENIVVGGSAPNIYEVSSGSNLIQRSFREAKTKRTSCSFWRNEGGRGNMWLAFIPFVREIEVGRKWRMFGAHADVRSHILGWCRTVINPTETD